MIDSNETALNFRVNQLIKVLPMELRRPVVSAYTLSDGTLLSFQEELTSQTWEYPELPVQDILDRIAYDVA